uniref:Serine aminopeptidase S33 domain-containing protein n=1 Tax=Timspurckia oligopyrenoides TaxID=708627 RepID=A0A7S0ZGB9_9RHOD|mmetsp:Transcript_4092/g.7191  ORF Transcript_4092/g.7191 Transcript_4092/m.7191 type:complete len:328 (+) Transcript_4092:124-1107(+)|eukprot:CAMPEP_0182451020 /NCGR_PEP_ID=MMETSP1172-20130603/43492_1 /TAXON_ID=708627 /ORGANISM="Timspurckia oligopyrenoides, Strain CCMP3278" /LENGTH=327 /DNA_ID=CAMNT_0024648755 /DNA_START=44 /DNA_END=1027 /DNA_ORIENTATION=-
MEESESTAVRYTKHQFESSTGLKIARYVWNCEEILGVNRIGAVFLVHGFRAHARFNFLRCIAPDQYEVYENSIIQKLNAQGFSVYAHDHIGHGESEGQRAYVDSFDALVVSTLEAISDVKICHQLDESLPLFIIGHSLGGSVAIAACMRSPHLFQGAIFSSPAVEPPSNMLGWKGVFLAQISGILSWLVPELEVLSLPPNALFPELHEMFKNDPLNSNVGLRARVGHEFLRLYKFISDNASELKTSFLITDGEDDGLVNPAGIVRFYEAADVKDKSVQIVPNMWHNLLIEPGADQVIDSYVEWIVKRREVCLSNSDADGEAEADHEN